jgi:hypothetical protein
MNKRMEFRLIFHFPFDICHCLILFNNKWKMENGK